MKETIRWLREIEHLANEVYLQAATIFADDTQFKKFLEHNAEDEAWHYHVMGSAAEYFSSRLTPIPAISVDQETRDRIIKYFYDIKEQLEKKAISREELIKKIVEVEISEWNDIFLYVLNTLKVEASEFIYPAARMQAHIKYIEYFLEQSEIQPEVLEQIKTIPAVWTENILIVDDEEMISSLIKSLLHRDGSIDVAMNGQEALDKVIEKFYKLIITDIDMPIMDGLSFFKEAVAKFPTLKSRFLFITGNLSPERQVFFDNNEIKHLSKPMAINELRDVATKIILSG